MKEDCWIQAIINANDYKTMADDAFERNTKAKGVNIII